MKRSSAVTLGLVPVMASWFMACNGSTPRYQQVCADSTNHVVDGQQCDDERRVAHPAGYIPIYHYYYAPYRAAGWAIGEILRGGSFVRPASGGIETGIVRGGFGSTAHGFGAGE